MLGSKGEPIKKERKRRVGGGKEGKGEREERWQELRGKKRTKGRPASSGLYTVRPQHTDHWSLWSYHISPMNIVERLGFKSQLEDTKRA